MWARRWCGAPPIWPSRVKVFLFSMGTGAVGLTIYTFMASSNVGYLDLARPSKSTVLCLDHWPLHNELASWFDQQSWAKWFEYQSGIDEYLDKHARCTDSAVQAEATCSTVSVPLHRVRGFLGAPLEFDREPTSEISEVLNSRDVLGIYAHLFLILSICLWCAISFHDHALLHSTSKDYILDVMGLRRDFPRFKRICGYLMGWRIIRRLCRFRRSWVGVAALPLAVILAPVLLVWRLLVFMFVVVPMAGVVFLCYPIKTSRLWTLLISIASAVYGVTLTVHMSFLLGSPLDRPRYAVTWEAGSCMCGCVYPVSQTTCGRLLMIGLLASVKASVVAFRTLKGLRRSNWANLISVTFAVPVNAYSVEWTQPDGRPIRFREAGEPIQSELAFDPFAMMDEQPESANSHVTLRPSSVLSREVDQESGTTKWRRSSSRRLQGPSIPSIMAMEVEEHEHLGCCGFPFRTGGVVGCVETDDPDGWKDVRAARRGSLPSDEASGQEETVDQHHFGAAQARGQVAHGGDPSAKESSADFSPTLSVQAPVLEETAACDSPLAAQSPVFKEAMVQHSPTAAQSLAFVECSHWHAGAEEEWAANDWRREVFLELRRSAGAVGARKESTRTPRASPERRAIEAAARADGFPVSPASVSSSPPRLPRIGLPLGSPTSKRSWQGSSSSKLPVLEAGAEPPSTFAKVPASLMAEPHKDASSVSAEPPAPVHLDLPMGAADASSKAAAPAVAAEPHEGASGDAAEPPASPDAGAPTEAQRASGEAPLSAEAGEDSEAAPRASGEAPATVGAEARQRAAGGSFKVRASGVREARREASRVLVKLPASMAADPPAWPER